MSKDWFINSETYVVDVVSRLYEEDLDPYESSVDVFVTFKQSGEKYVVTFIPITELNNLLTESKYVAFDNTIVVHELTQNAIGTAISGLVSQTHYWQSILDSCNCLEFPRIMRHKSDNGEEKFGIHEVTFELDGSIEFMGYADSNLFTTVSELRINLSDLVEQEKKTFWVMGELGRESNRERIRWWLETAFDHPILDYIPPD